MSDSKNCATVTQEKGENASPYYLSSLTPQPPTHTVPITPSTRQTHAHSPQHDHHSTIPSPQQGHNQLPPMQRRWSQAHQNSTEQQSTQQGKTTLSRE
eukprot:1156867-Rhodomonas_salina.2